MEAPSGEQFRLVQGDQEAVVTEVGASLRAYSAGGHEVVAGYPEDQLASGGRGQVLAPWPNRLEDGTYEQGGACGKAALDEPERHNAIHGLVRWQRFELVARHRAAVRLRCEPPPQPAYPFALRLEIGYALDEEGLTVEAEATCRGDRELPFGLGFHPYLDAGGGLVDELLLGLPARRRLLLDDRGLPVGVEDVAGTPYDFRTPRALGDLVLDDCFTALDAGRAGTAEVTLADRGSGRGVTLWAGEGFRYVMCYTGDTLGDAAQRRRSVAVEPMTCAPNALRSGAGLVTLAAGERWTGSWGIRPGWLAQRAGG